MNTETKPGDSGWRNGEYKNLMSKKWLGSPSKSHPAWITTLQQSIQFYWQAHKYLTLSQNIHNDSTKDFIRGLLNSAAQLHFWENILVMHQLQMNLVGTVWKSLTEMVKFK